jgi:hypothetical protein
VTYLRLTCAIHFVPPLRCGSPRHRKDIVLKAAFIINKPSQLRALPFDENICDSCKMSDDGHYAYPSSPYSDLEDLLYDADPGPDLADELAAHCVHSPVYEYVPGYELSEYHSDWEYYSDDYYDDDPSLLGKGNADGEPTKTEKNAIRGKKRKLADRDADVPRLDLADSTGLTNCMRGTVWKEEATIVEKDNIFRTQGENEKVALLRDWKERFGVVDRQQSKGKKRPKLPDDESWAYDMSLSQMGLMNERGSRLERTESGAGPGGEEPEDEYEDGYEDDLNEDEEAAIAEMAGAIREGSAATLGIAGVSGDEGVDEMPLPLHPPKRTRRMKADLLPSPPTSTEASTADPDALKLPENDKQATVKRGRGRPRKVTVQEVEQTNSSKINGDSTRSGAAAGSKKRKASESPPPGEGANGTQAATIGRGKRLASSANAIKTKEDGSSQEAPKTRSMRTRKK